MQIEHPTKPILVWDKREKMPLVFQRLQTMPGILWAGDYSIVGAQDCFAVERKSVRDLVACSTGRERERFSRAMQRLAGYQFSRLLVVGTEAAVKLHRTAYHFVLQSEIRYNLPVVYSHSPEAAAAMIERWALWFAHDLTRRAAALQNPQPTTNTIETSA